MTVEWPNGRCTLGLAPLQALNENLLGESSPSPAPDTVTPALGASSSIANSASSSPSATPSVAGSIAAAAASAAANQIPGVAALRSLDVSRVVAIVLGLILIGGGIIMFRPVGDVVREGASAAVKSGKEAALAA